MIYALTVDGSPKVWKRPRSTRHGGIMYNPNRPAQLQFGRACSEQFGTELLRGPLRVELFFMFPRPAAHFDRHGRLRADAPEWYTRVTDIDNLVKFALDSINQVVYVDDSQVVELRAVKRYAEGTVGRTTLTVETL